MTPSGHAGRLPTPPVFLAGEEPAFNILFVGHPTPANLSERLARTGHSGDQALPTMTITCRGPVERGAEWMVAQQIIAREIRAGQLR